MLSKLSGLIVYKVSGKSWPRLSDLFVDFSVFLEIKEPMGEMSSSSVG